MNEDYAEVLKKKKEAYAMYRKAKEEMKEYQTAKYNVDQFLRSEEELHTEQKKKNTPVI